MGLKAPEKKLNRTRHWPAASLWVLASLGLYSCGGSSGGSVSTEIETPAPAPAPAPAPNNSDEIAPTVLVTFADSTLDVGQTTQIIFIFSEKVTNFTLDDISAPGSISGLTSADGINWTVNYKHSSTTPGEKLIAAVKQDSYTDLAGNLGDARDPAAAVVNGGANAPITLAGSLPHTGINSNQCYGTDANDLLIPCTNSAALDLSGAGKQDGMYAHINAMSYSQVGKYPITSCVKDNITGLIWEGKEGVAGPRFALNYYTNYDSITSPQKTMGSNSSKPTQADIDAASNTIGYKNYVNSIALCGYTDWRLPTADELETLVDYSLIRTRPTINRSWFPNTSGDLYWTSTNVNEDTGSWAVDFFEGFMINRARDNKFPVRLVRAAP